MFVGFIRARPEDRNVHLGSLGLFEGAMGVIRERTVVGLHSSAPWGSSVSFVLVVFIRALHSCRRVQVGSFGRLLALVGGRPCGHWASFGSFMRGLVVVWFI